MVNKNINKNLNDVFEEFLVEKREDLTSEKGNFQRAPTYGNFPDDIYDEVLWDFFSNLTQFIFIEKINEIDLYKIQVMMSELENPKIDFDPNKKVKEGIGYAINKFFNNNENKDFPIDLYPKGFQNKIKKWVIINLEKLFLNNFHQHKEKFTTDSIHSIINAAVKYIIDVTYHYMIKSNGSIEDDIETINPVVSWYDTVSLPLLFITIDNFLYDLFNSGKIDNDIIYWIKPNKYFSFPELLDFGEESKEILEKKINEILEIIKDIKIPDGVFSEELIKIIKKFNEDILNNIYEIISDNRNYCFTSLKNSEIIVHRIFLHLAYSGFVNGEIPGIKQGVYSSKQLENELDEFYKFKDKD